METRVERQIQRDDVADGSSTPPRPRADAPLAERAALHAGDERLRRAITIGTVGVLFFRLDGRIVDANATFERMSGYTLDELRSETHWEHLTPLEFREVTRRAAEELASRGETAPYEKQLIRKDGSRWWGLFAPTRLSGEGVDSECVEFILDVTESRRATEALAASEARYRTLVENVPDYAIFLLDERGIVTEWPAGAERVKGYRPEEVIGRHVSLFYTPEDIAAGAPERELAEAAELGRSERETWRVRKGGERFWANDIATVIRDGSGRLVGFTRISRDLTERRRAEEAAERARIARERDSLRQQLAVAEEEERRRLARELHDEAGQHLAALGVGLQALSDVAPPGSEIDRRAARLRSLVSTMGQELHSLAVRLRPRALDDFGLEPALAVYADEWARQSGIAVDLHAGVASERLPAPVESAVYRVVQEALTNVAKHSAATRASVVIERRDDELVAIVEDNGRGFDVNAFDWSRRDGARAAREGLGLLGIRERVTLLGGSVELESAIGAGTSLYIHIPVERSSDVPQE